MRRLLSRYALLTLVLVLVFSVPYVAFMCEYPLRSFGSRVTSVIEAMNYSVQTVTTIGYGNWVSDVPPCRGRPVRIPLGSGGVTVPGVLLMKAASVPFMAVGAVFFAITIGLAVELIKLPAPEVQSPDGR